MKTKCKQLSENTYQFPHWNTIADTYSEAVNMVLAEIDKSRPLYNWREGQITEKTIRKRKETEKGIKQCTSGGVVTLEVQLGEKYRGKSVKEVRNLFDNNEFGLGAYEIGCILLANPDILQSSDDLFLDCAGDEFDDPAADARFDHAPVFRFHGGGVKFGSGWYGYASQVCGSVSAFLPSSKLETLDTFDLSELEIVYKGKTYKLEEK